MPLSMERLNEMSLERAQTAPDSFASKPLPPDNFQVTAGKRRFTIQWSQVEGVDGYRVIVIDDQDASQPDLIKTISGSTTLEWVYPFPNVAATRYFAVQSFSADESSEFTELVSATTTIDVPNLLVSDFTSNAHTGDTDETDLVTYTMPGNTMGTGDAIRITAWGGLTNDGSNKTIRLRVGGNSVTSQNTTNAASWIIECVISSRNSTSSQTVMFHTRHLTSAETFTGDATLSEDTTSDIIIKFTGTLADVNDSISVNGWMIERLTGETGEAEPPAPPAQPVEPSIPGSPQDRGFPTE